LISFGPYLLTKTAARQARLIAYYGVRNLLKGAGEIPQGSSLFSAEAARLLKRLQSVD
jgi:hypothetical protein